MKVYAPDVKGRLPLPLCCKLLVLDGFGKTLTCYPELDLGWTLLVGRRSERIEGTLCVGV